MNKQPTYSTWRQAILLWLFTNLFGTVGVYLSFAAIAATEGLSSWADASGAIEAIIGLIAAATSLLVIPVAFVAFRCLLAIDNHWQRLLATGIAIVSFFFLLVVAAAYGITGKWILLLSMLALGGWAYLLAALVSAALVYQRELFRPSESTKPNTTQTQEPTV